MQSIKFSIFGDKIGGVDMFGNLFLWKFHRL